MDYKEKLLELVAQNGRVDFIGEVQLDSYWDGVSDVPYYARYMDEEGIHISPDDDVESTDCYTPITPDDYDDFNYEDWEDLFHDVN